MDWREGVPKQIIEKMIQEKTDPWYEMEQRPSCKDTFAEVAIAVSKRSVCLFYDVGAVIFKNNHVLSTGYNGPVSGDVHCTKVGCSKIVEGEIKSGTGLCRGTHAELNAIGNAARYGVNIEGATLLITWAPCFTCAKQIVNAGIKHVLFLIDYNDTRANGCLQNAEVSLTKYQPRLESLANYVKELRTKYEKQ